MTSASKSRIQRKAAAKAASILVPGSAPKAIITLTEVPGTNAGFTIGLGLHGARMEELHPGEQHPVSIVDVIALALTTIIRTQPQDFKDALDQVNNTLLGVQSALEGGADLREAMSAADDALGGAIGDIDVEPETADDA